MTEQCAGARIAADRFGRGEKRILMLHGWGCERGMMRPLGEKLAAAGHEILIPDFPGHGESGRPPEPWGVPEYAECVLELLEKQEFAPCAVIAHSFGGRVATWIASERPDVFTRIILTGAAGIRAPQTEEGKRRSEAYQKWKRAEQQMEKIGLLRPVALKLKHRIQEKYGSADYNALDDEMKKTFVKVIQLDLSDRYARIQAPTLLMWGDRDTETPLWMGQRMEKEIPDAALILLEGGSHFAYLEQGEKFALIAAEFLK